MRLGVSWDHVERPRQLTEGTAARNELQLVRFAPVTNLRTRTMMIKRELGSWILNANEMSRMATGLKACGQRRSLCSCPQPTLSIWMNETERER